MPGRRVAHPVDAPVSDTARPSFPSARARPVTASRYPPPRRRPKVRRPRAEEWVEAGRPALPNAAVAGAAGEAEAAERVSAAARPVAAAGLVTQESLSRRQA